MKDLDLVVYKKLLHNLGEYSEKLPATTTVTLFRQVLENGLKVVPKDEVALEILDYVLSGSVPKSIQDLLNLRFEDLPLELRPLYKEDSSFKVAFWKNDSVVSDKVVSLIDFGLNIKDKGWCDGKGNIVDLIKRR